MPYAEDVRVHSQHLRLHARARLVCRRGGARSAGLSALGAGGEQPNMLEEHLAQLLDRHVDRDLEQVEVTCFCYVSEFWASSVALLR